jgi:uncharacterized protein (DUF885 family)
MDTGSTDLLSPLEKEIVTHLFVLYPTRAADLGLHQYDGLLSDLSRESTNRWATAAKELLRRLDKIPESDLPPPRRLDRNLLRLNLEGALFEIEETREYDRNPMNYLFQPYLTNYIARDYAPVDDRAGAIARILTAFPSVLEAAKRRLDPILPRPFLTLSIQMASGLPTHFEEGETFAATGSAAVRDEVRNARKGADAAARSFAEWLQKERLPQANDDFALGPKRFQRLLWVREGLVLPVSDLLSRGRADLKRNQDRLAEIARKEGTSVDLLVQRQYEKHPTPEELLPLVRRITDDTREFVRRKDLVTIPQPEICHVRETPPFARDLWTAACSSPGPFEKPVDGIYWVTGVDPAWTPEQAESWMRTLNYAMLKNTTIHEVWPGHYLQGLHFRKTSQTLARKVWFSSSFGEGWAHYCEQVALEVGFDGGSVPAEVIQLHDALLRDCRLIVSIGMHTQGMSVADAAALLRTEAHLVEVHAQREAIRGTYNPEYFCYTLGKLAILDGRSKYLNTRFHGSLKTFHDTLLGFGAPPIGFLDSLLAGA